MAQTVAFELQCPLAMITLLPTDSKMVTSVNQVTGGSTGSSVCCMAAALGCKPLKARLDAVKNGKTMTWAQVCATASASNVMMMETGFHNGSPGKAMTYDYYIWGAAVSVCELDILSGRRTILSTNIAYDCGQSLNPLIDIGQVEGGFMIGVGELLNEQILFNSLGEMKTAGTWDYKPPTAHSIPIDFNVHFLENVPNPNGFQGSKATGEPPMLLSVSVFFALKNAIRAAREEVGMKDWFPLNPPLTPAKCVAACQVADSQLKM